MTHKITEQLRTLLKAYAERAAKVRADAKPVVDEGEQRRRACGERLQKLVRPALLRFLTELENAGHDASVQDHTDSVDTYPSVALSFTPRASGRSEEHTSELQSQFHLVCRLLLEKKKNKLRHKTSKTEPKTKLTLT